jgi:hypothetical protein
MVVEMRPLSARTCLQIFPFKNQPSESYGAGCMASIDVKLGSQIWQILLHLGFQLESEAEIAP